MTMEFGIARWAAWAPALAAPESWKRWFTEPWPLPPAEVAPLAWMAPLLRRRVDRLGRAALEALAMARGDETLGAPLVFASRYGDLTRTRELFGSLLETGTVSPASFSLSVHNAVGALSSIARGDTAPYTAVSSGPETVEAAFCEAWGQLQDGAPNVWVVVYDEPVPAPWETSAVAGDAFHRAFACQVVPSKPGAGRYRLEWGVGGPNATSVSPSPLPPDLEVLKFVALGATLYEHSVGPRCWRWHHDSV